MSTSETLFDQLPSFQKDEPYLIDQKLLEDPLSPLGSRVIILEDIELDTERKEKLLDLLMLDKPYSYQQSWSLPQSLMFLDHAVSEVHKAIFKYIPKRYISRQFARKYHTLNVLENMLVQIPGLSSKMAAKILREADIETLCDLYEKFEGEDKADWFIMNTI